MNSHMEIDVMYRLNRAGRLLIIVLGTLAVTGLAAASTKPLPHWWPAERLPGYPAGCWSPGSGSFQACSTVSVGPGGSALVFGFPDSAGHTRVLFRPSGGPPGSPHALPAAIGYPTGTPLIVDWFPNGSSLIDNPGADMLAFRPPGAKASVETPQNLGLPQGGEGPAAIATAPSGVALIGLAGNKGVGVAFRSPGAKGSVDMLHAQYFGPGTLLGVALDPKKGGAVVAWTDANVLEQAVRRPGATSFVKPRPIVTAPYGVAMADSSGYAVIAWAGGPPGPDSYPSQVFATERGPGGGFGTVRKIGDSPNGDPLYAVPAITSAGDALVAWTRIASSSAFGATIATEHRGHWGPQKGDGAAGSQIDGMSSAGKHLLIFSDTRSDKGTRYDLQMGSSTKNGLTIAGAVRVPAGIAAMGVSASGTALYTYQQLTGGKVQFFLKPYESRGYSIAVQKQEFR
jgi:hypothetical protein